MKKILFLISITLFAFSCTNRDIEFEDFDYQSVYFPFQTPLRTIMLGDEVVGDNTIDLEHAFSVGVTTGGVLDNKSDVEVRIELASELMDTIVSVSGDTLEILPLEYYEATFDKIDILAGSFYGKLRVDLNDEFFADPKAVGLHYVLPLRIIDTDTDTILSGLPYSGIENLDVRIPDQWEIAPKNYTLFGVKYINPYHGSYLLRGKTNNTIIDPLDTASIYYSARFLTDNRMVNLSSKSLTESILTIVGGMNTGGMYSALLTFDESDQTIVVSPSDSTSVVINGTGTFFTKDDADCEGYNEKKHRTIYLDYTYEDGGDTFQANDSLVFLDTDIKFEEFEYSVLNPDI